MLINRRNALMAGKRLPYDAEVEFLQSTGTQYILTGVAGGAVRWEIGAKADRTTTQVLASMNREANGGYYFGVLSGVWGFGGSGNNTTISGTTYADINATIVGTGTSTATVNGQSCSRTQLNTAQADEWMLFASSPTSFPFYGRIYYARCYQNGVLVRDFIPVRKGTTGELYDRVSGKLFGNAGSGAFVVGPDVVPVEYIESHGTEWINTGTIASECSQAELSFAVRTLGFRNFLFGCNSNSYGFAEVSTGNLFKTEAPSTYSILPLVQYKAIFYKSDFSVVVNGTTLNIVCGTSTASIFSRNANFAISATAVGSQYRGKMLIYGLKLYSDSGIFHSYKPVRVGSGSTWEGAMMDTLTRRIYRNQGTGAFGYGNDLKYPIPA